MRWRGFGLGVIVAVLAACNGGPTCDQLKKAMDAACAIDENSQACQIAAQQWEKKCGVKPTPTPTVEPTVEPTVPPPTPPPTNPPPVVSCHPAPDDPGWGKPISPATRPSQMFKEYLVVVRGLPDSCGQAAPDEAPQRATLDRIAAKWRELFPGRCVSSPGDWGGVGDSVSVRAPDGIYEEIHAVYYGNGCTLVTEGAYKNGWPCTGCSGGVEPTPPPPTPPPTPPPNGGCPPPIPPPVKKITVVPHNNLYDSTAKTCDRAYCAAIGSDQICCPARLEGDPNRVACEATWGTPVWTGDGNVKGTENPYQARCSDCTWIRMCLGDVCGEYSK